MENEVLEPVAVEEKPNFVWSVESDVDREAGIREALNKFCAKYGKRLDAVCSISSEKIKVVVSDPTGPSYVIDKFRFDIEMKMPELKHEGYSHVATLKIELNEDGAPVNMVFPAKKYESESFVRYFDTAFRCDHCKTNRERRTVHLWRNEAGDDLMIASSCSKEYFGESIAKALRGFENYSREMIESDFEMEFGGCGRFSPDVAGRIKFAKLAFGLMMDSNQYVSKSRAEENMKSSTSDDVDTLLSRVSSSGLSSDEYIKRVNERNEKIDFYNGVADAKGFDIVKIKEFWDSKYEANPDDNFVRNCWINFSLAKVRYGMLTYSIFLYCKEVLGLGVDKSANLPSNYVGEIGKRLRGLKLKVVYRNSFDTAYGLCFVNKMIDEAGNAFVWMTGTGLEMDANVVLDGTVKDQKEYKGRKETVLSRCKIKE